MRELILEELGYFTTKECETIKEHCEGKTFMRFHINWSNWAGNCTLMVSTHYECEKEELKNFFCHYVLGVLCTLKKES